MSPNQVSALLPERFRNSVVTKKSYSTVSPTWRVTGVDMDVSIPKRPVIRPVLASGVEKEFDCGGLYCPPFAAGGVVRFAVVQVRPLKLIDPDAGNGA